MTVIAYGPNAQGELGMGWRGATQVTPVVSSLAPADTVDVQASYHFTGFLGANVVRVVPL